MAPPHLHDLAFVLSAKSRLQAGCFSVNEYTRPVPVGWMRASWFLNVWWSRYLLRLERLGADASLGPISQFDSLESVTLI